MTVFDVISRVMDITKERSTSEEILFHVNTILQRLAAGTPIALPSSQAPVYSSPIPDLLTSDSVETIEDFSANVPLPDDYQRSVVKVSSNENPDLKIQIFKPFREFLEWYPSFDNTGNVVAVSVSGRNLYYQKIPETSDTLTIWYYKTIDLLTDMDESPDWIPDYLHDGLMVNYSVMRILEMLAPGSQQDAGGLKVYEDRFRQGMFELEAYCQGTA
jgi:hypothetical protein